VLFNERRARVLLSRCLVSEMGNSTQSFATRALAKGGRAGLLSLLCVIVILMALPAANLNLNAPRPKTLSTQRKSGESDGRAGMF
jgi:hypothetical protein